MCPGNNSVLDQAEWNFHSTCAVVVARVILNVQLDPADYPRKNLKINITTVLEPLLSIITACLPLCCPALKKVTGHKQIPKSKSRNVVSSSVARILLTRAKSSAFPVIDHSSVLIKPEELESRNHITDPGGKPNDSVESCGRVARIREPHQSSIWAGQDWEVQLNETRSLEGKR